jgi:hypothetical protein
MINYVISSTAGIAEEERSFASNNHKTQYEYQQLALMMGDDGRYGVRTRHSIMGRRYPAFTKASTEQH